MNLGDSIAIAIAVAGGMSAVYLVVTGLMLLWFFESTLSQGKMDPKGWFESRTGCTLEPSDRIEWFRATGDVASDVRAVRDVLAVVTDHVVVLHCPGVWRRQPTCTCIDRGDGPFRLVGGSTVVGTRERLELRGLPPQPLVDSLLRRGWLVPESTSKGR